MWPHRDIHSKNSTFLNADPSRQPNETNLCPRAQLSTISEHSIGHAQLQARRTAGAGASICLGSAPSLCRS